jgi:signal transduction histidine kinase
MERAGGTQGGDALGALDEVNRLSVLVDGLLELARAEKLGSSPEPIDASALVMARRDAWAAFAEEHDVRIDVRVDGAAVMATPGRLDQVLDNLLNNALEVAPPGSAVEVFAVRAGDLVRLGVSDAGPGLDEQQRARAFDRFWSSGDDSVDGGSGFGLGLAIVRQLVVADGGGVTLGSSATGGLEVTIALPAADRRGSSGGAARSVVLDRLRGTKRRGEPR